VPEFVPGLELSRAFYDEVVATLLDDVPHSAALLGTGSDVLGLDTERSTDHGWGPRLQLFVEEEDVERVRLAIDDGLPDEFRGWPTRFGWDDVAVSHHVEVLTLERWLEDGLGFDPRQGVALVDWLATPQQLLLEVTRGTVHRDENGHLAAVRTALTWYPEEVWMWLLACQWRLDQAEPFVGRAAEVGDELGSRILAGRLARDLVRLCFLLERQYVPFAQLAGSAGIREHLLTAVSARTYQGREESLVRAAGAVAALHNARGVTQPVDEAVGFFHSRPFRVLGSSRFVDACLERVRDPRLRALPLVGAIDQLADSTDFLSSPATPLARRAVYDALLA
jgi:hypothetical protein